MTAEDAYTRVLNQLVEVTGYMSRGRDRERMARCPSHNDREASLSVGIGRDGVVLKCQAGCPTETVVAALGLAMRDLFNKPKESKRDEPIATYDYVDEQGQLLFQVCRFPGKQFRQRRRDGNSWSWGLGDTRRVLYRLPQVVEAAKNSETVYVVEGEKDVHALEKAGATATCNSMGAGKWRQEYTEALRGCGQIIIIADRDEPGRVHAQEVAANFDRLNMLNEVVEAAEGKDAYDHLAAGHGLDDWQRPGTQTQIDGAALLGDVKAFLGRFVAYPNEHAHVAHTLWIFHTHLMDAWESTPRIAFLSPEPGSGKTRALEASELLVPNAVEAVNVTPAYLFRKVGEHSPTILYDEIDTVFGPKAKDNEEIRGLLNAGHRRGAVAGRCIVRGKVVETEEIPAYCAVALAGLGDVPDTLLSRSVVVRMRRRAPTERIEPFRRRVHEAEGHKLRNQIAAWAESITGDMKDSWPDMPDGIEDRDADVWEALLAIADAAGGHWPDTARVAAVALVADSKAGTPSLGVRLLGDVRAVFNGHETMSSADLIRNLIELDEAPWGDLRGKPLDARGLANRLRRYDVASIDMRIGDWHGKGYRLGDLEDAWSRYLPTRVGDIKNHSKEDKEGEPDSDLGPPPQEPATAATSATCPNCTAPVDSTWHAQICGDAS